MVTEAGEHVERVPDPVSGFQTKVPVGVSPDTPVA